jgi:hypothetical protein
MALSMPVDLESWWRLIFGGFGQTGGALLIVAACCRFYRLAAGF